MKKNYEALVDLKERMKGEDRYVVDPFISEIDDILEMFPDELRADNQ